MTLHSHPLHHRTRKHQRPEDLDEPIWGGCKYVLDDFTKPSLYHNFFMA